MIVADTSALIAVLFDEEEAKAFSRLIFQERTCLVAAPTVLQFFMVAEGKSKRATMLPQDVLDFPNVVIEPWTERHLAIAHSAFARFGKGQGHRAQLNFGDCISYALAKAENAPLLYKGGDFALTDVRAAA